MPDVFFTNDDFQEVIQAFNSRLVEKKPTLSFPGPSWYLRQIRLEGKVDQDMKSTRALFDCLQELQNISALISASHYSQWTDDESKYLDGKLIVSEYHLAILWEQSSSGTNGYRDECLCIAGFVFVSVYLKDRGRASAVHLDLLGRLELCVKRSVPELGWSWCWGTIGDELLLWVLFIGATSSLQDDKKRLWFKEAIITLTERIRLWEWDFVECTLKGLFCSTQFLRESRAIWDEVGAHILRKSDDRILG
jgi:hypothetical protein